jgi:hypothetical protein
MWREFEARGARLESTLVRVSINIPGRVLAAILALLVLGVVLPFVLSR